MSVTVTGTKRHLDLNSSTLTTTGNITAGGNILLGDSQYIHLGDNPDLKIYHNGSHSFIQDTGAGDLRLLGSSIKLQNTSEANILTLASDLSATFAGSVTINSNSFSLDGTAPTMTVNSSNNASGFRINVTGLDADGDDLFRAQDSGTTRFTIKRDGDGIFTGDVTVNRSVDTSSPTITIGNDDNKNMKMGVVRSAAGTAPNTSFIAYDGDFRLIPGSGNSTEKFTLNSSGNATFAGTVTATHFYGDGSNLTGITASNADTVDNLHASSFIRSDANDTATGVIDFTGGFKPKHYAATDDLNSDTRTIFSTHSVNNATSNRPINYSSVYTLGGSTGNALQISTNEDYSESGMWIRQYNQNSSSPQGTGWQNWAEVWTTNHATLGKITEWNAAYTYSQVAHLPLAGGDMTGDINLGSGSASIKKTANTSGNYPAIELYSSGTSDSGAAIAIQQATSEGDTIIFADYEPHVEWGISAENSANEIHFTGGSTSGSLGSKTFKSNAGNNRTAYKKMTVNLSSGNVAVGGTLTSGAHTINSGADAILTLNQTGTDTGWSYINFNTSGTRNWYVGQDNNKNFDIYNDNTDSLGLSIDYNNNTVSVGTLTWSGGSSTNANTAYGWGNHASAGYLTSLPSHNHDDRYYTETEIDNFGFLTSSSTQSKYLRSDQNDTATGSLTINGDLTVDGTTFGLYHGTVEDDYYFDSYNGSKHLSTFIKNARADIIRYQSIDNLEYWNGSSWQDMTSQLANVKKLLDGRQDTYWAVPSTYYKFRFTVSPSTVWPLQAKIGQQLSWSGSTYPGSTMLIEEDANDGNGFQTLVTANFTSTNGVTNWGLMFKADSALHTGKGGSQRTRITVDYYGWSPSNSSHTTIPLQNLFITSNYAGTENTDYTNLLDYDRNATFAGRILNTYTGTSTHQLKNGTSNGTVLELITSGDGRTMYFQSDHIWSSGSFYLGNNSYNTIFRGNTYSFENGNATFAGDVTLSNASTPQLRVTDTTNSVISKIMSDNTTGFVGTHSDHNFSILRNNSVQATFNSTGATFASDVGMVTGHSSGKFAVMSTAVHGSYDFYNNGTSYFNGAVTVDDNLTVAGNLTVNGTTTTINTATVEVEDNILQLNTTQGSPDTATAATSGISIYRGNGVTQASFIFDDADDTWDLTNNLKVAGNVDIYTGAGLATLNIGRNASEKLQIDQTDNETVLTANNDSDGDGDHNFRLNRVFAGSGANNFKIQKDGSDQLSIDTNANATFAGDVTVGPKNNATVQVSESGGATVKMLAGSVGRIGTYTDDELRIVTDGSDRLTISNTGAATFAGDITTNGDIIIDNSSGDPFLKLKTTAQEWVVRIDQSDSEKFQIRNVTGADTALSIDTSSNATFAGNIVVSGTVDGRDIATDGTKLDTIDTNADVTPSWVPSSDPGYFKQGSYSVQYTGDMDSLTGFRIIRSTSGSNRAFSGHHNVITIPNSGASQYGAQLAFETGTVADGGIKFRNSTNGTFTGWYRLYHEGHLPTLTELGAQAAGTYSTATGVADNADVTPSWVPSSDPGYLTSSSTQSKYLRSDTADTATGKIVLEGNSAAWDPTTPGATTGSLHFDPGVGTDHFGNAITFGASDSSNGTTAQAGIYLRTDGGYGSRMYFATTDSYATGSKVAMYINHNKDVYFLDDIDVSGNIAVGGTVDGRNIATDGTKLDTIATNADVTPSWVPSSNPSYLTGITSSQVTTALGYTPMNSSQTTISSAQSQKLGYITVTQAVDLDEIETGAANGNTAHGWGNHGSAGYLTSSSTQTKYLRSDQSDQVNGNLIYLDNVKAAFGTSSDFQIYHDGTNNIIKNTKHGQNTYLQSENSSGTNQNCIVFGGSSGSVELRYNNANRLSTTTNGVELNGTITLNNKLELSYTSTSGSQFEQPSTSVTTYRVNSDRWRVWMGNGSSETFTVTEGGRIGINDSSPDYTLDVYGNVSNTSIYASHDIVAYSDIRVKDEIETITDALEKVNKLRGVTFVRTDEGSSDKRMMGVIAQEVEEVIPEVVTTKDSDGHKAVAYGNMVGVLIEAVKELTAEVEELKKLKCKCNGCTK
jgi:hypothetical protein